MWYWSALSIILILLIGLSFCIWKIKFKDDEKDNEMERGECAAKLIITVILFIPLAILCIDIPSALRGGETVYTTELPTCYRYSKFHTEVITDNEELRHLRGPNWNRYEKYGKYRISYTHFTKIVLKVEKLD